MKLRARAKIAASTQQKVRGTTAPKGADISDPPRICRDALTAMFGCKLTGTGFDQFTVSAGIYSFDLTLDMPQALACEEREYVFLRRDDVFRLRFLPILHAGIGADAPFAYATVHLQRQDSCSQLPLFSKPRRPKAAISA